MDGEPGVDRGCRSSLPRDDCGVAERDRRRGGVAGDAERDFSSKNRVLAVTMLLRLHASSSSGVEDLRRWLLPSSTSLMVVDVPTFRQLLTERVCVRPASFTYRR